ncbi:peptidase M3 [Bacteroidetes/Chlorobi group bacterium MS-B_bin-24]|jgi:peptidyl-dipeptidase A|nr:MAG: peptidase M3 [Bacteroidetes/Chlorobi group bacterium MS-B_bin-24]
MFKSFFSVVLALGILLLVACSKEKFNSEEARKMEQEYEKLIADYEALMKPAYKDMSLQYFIAATNSTPENWELYAQKEMLVNKILSDKQLFERFKKIKESNLIQDPIKRRRIEVLYLTFLGKQVDTAKLNQITKLQSEIENKYSTFRAEYRGKKLSDNDVEEILKTSTNNKELQEVWEAQKKIGRVVASDIIKLVKMRNEIARELGFKNYHEMSLKLSEQDPAEIEKLFDELDNLTRNAFATEKSKMDEILAKRYNIKKEDLMPWHYQNRFFQEAPKIYDVDLDQYYKNKDIVQLAKDYYLSIGLPIDDIVARSDLFERENKNQHAFCINIDRDAKDIRVLCNIKPNARWMETMLHENGHALYEKYLDEKLPWDLKTPAHIFTTEAIAMLFGRFATNPQWIVDMLKISTEEAKKIQEPAQNTLRLQQIVFSRWSQVMFRFEKSLYENPDQDLNKLWWDLVEKYQMLKKPAGRNEPDWATKIHIATSPCYYHNYLLGELLASQLQNYIITNIIKGKLGQDYSFVNNKEVGKYLIDKVFSVGAKYQWNEMIEKATGEKLTPKYYAKQFLQ